jgi:hypothetical protein
MRVHKAFGHIEHHLKLHSGGGAVIASPTLTSLSENCLASLKDPKLWAESQYMRCINKRKKASHKANGNRDISKHLIGMNSPQMKKVIPSGHTQMQR